MSNLVNLQRDMVWCSPGATAVTWPTVNNAVNSDGVVHQDAASIVVASTSDASASGTRVGIFLQQPQGERTPYRVRAWTSQGNIFNISYANGSVTGTNDAIQSGSVLISANSRQLDEIFCVDATSGNDPIFFGFTSSGTSIYQYVFMSVQRLNVAPPNYQSAVS
jgi:hypothetical protein